MRPNHYIFFLSSLFLVSCSYFEYKNYENKIATPSIAVKEDTLFVYGNWPKESWWELFDSKELTKLIDEALVYNPSIQSAYQRIEQAKQIALQKRSILIPWFNLSFSEQFSQGSKTGVNAELNPSLPLNSNLLNLALTMSYPFDFWNKYRNMFAAALGIVKAQQAEEKQVELLITTTLAEAYFSLAINVEKKILYEKLLSLQTKLANLDDLLKASGLDSNFPVYSSIENREDAKKMVLGIEDEIAINRHLINALIGKGPDANIEVLFLSRAPKRLFVPENISLNLVAKRPDLMAAVWRMESLSHEVGAKVADFFPDVTLQALFGLQTLQPSKFFTNQATNFSVTPAFNLPIFTAGYIRAGVDEKKAEFEEAVREYNRLVLEAAKEVSNKFVSLQTFYEQKMSQQVIVENAQLRLSLRKARVESGLDNLLDLYYEEIALIHRELQNLDLLFGQYYSVVELIKSLGGGYDDQTS